MRTVSKATLFTRDIHERQGSLHRPGDIALKPGELRSEFYGAEDLAAKLLELSKAMPNDWPAFPRGREAAAAIR